jgi:hypothetical protein
MPTIIEVPCWSYKMIPTIVAICFLSKQLTRTVKEILCKVVSWSLQSYFSVSKTMNCFEQSNEFINLLHLQKDTDNYML